MGATPQIEPHHPAALLLLVPFIVIFLWAAWIEIDRWRKGQTPDDNRDMFVFDDRAPRIHETRPDKGHANNSTDRKG